MKKKLCSNFLMTTLTLVLFSFYACSQESAPPEGKAEAVQEAPTVQASLQGVEWMSMEEALKAQAENPKPIFVDIYTDWCGWCKVMDKKTFSQAQVASYMNERYYMVKFNAEKEAPIEMNGKKYELVNAGKRSIHTLAYAMLDGKMSYPSYVILDSELQRMGIMKGFKEPEAFLSSMEDYQPKKHGVH
jgi:thioredoxin-related protein